jgi:cell division protein FtsZ
MKSIVEEAMIRAENELKSQESVQMVKPQEKTPVATPQNEQDLDEILKQLQTVISVVGVGGGGSNTINRMMEEGITGARLVAVNTDAQHLVRTKADKKILIGKQRTHGLGAGSIPQIGEEAAVETEAEIKKAVEGCDMVFITAGLGGEPEPERHPSSPKLPARRGHSPSGWSPSPSPRKGRYGVKTQRPDWNASETSPIR